MANHKSSVKRIRQTHKNRLHNRYYAKTARNAVRNLRATKEADAAAALLPQVASMLDKLAKRNMIHKNKASNLKAKLAKHVNKLSK
jgi:small subunit ribosomal protein S20